MMTINIEFHTGNLICGANADAISAINFDATVAEFCKQVEAELAPDYSVKWDLVRAEGPGLRVRGSDVTEDDKEAVMAADEKVFNLGSFWVNN